MDKIGIICEYNPFHNGHLYHLKKIKELYKNSFVTLVLSTNFTQRGEISFLTKWDKTRIALEYGVDLVIELPFIFTTQSADIFSKNAIKILEALEMDYLIFGSETNDVQILKNLASTILYHKDYDTLVKKYLDLGYNYPTSMSKALFNLTNIKIINSNDLLALSYLKVILSNNLKIKPLTIKRTNNYLNNELTNNISSATSIRKAFLNNIDISNQVPEITLDKLTITKDYQERYFLMLKYKLINEINELDKYADCSEGLDKRIKKYILKVNNYDELLEKMKTKRYTYNRLNRMFLHILLNFTKDDQKKYQDINYLRILGFNKRGRLYLKKIKNNSNILFVTNYKDSDDFVLKFELKATLLYLTIINRNDLISEELKSIPIKKN